MQNGWHPMLGLQTSTGGAVWKSDDYTRYHLQPIALLLFVSKFPNRAP
jgi:hypothetical protein